MKKIFRTHRPLNGEGRFEIDRIDDKVRCILEDRKVIEPTEFEEALELFEDDGLAYAMRFVPDIVYHPDSRGELVAYKESDFPKDLTFLYHQAASLPAFNTGIIPEQERVEWLAANCTEEFKDFYCHFPELLGPLHREVFLGLSHIQYAAMSNDAAKMQRWAQYVSNLLYDFIYQSTCTKEGWLYLDHDDCLEFLGIADDLSKGTSDYEVPYDMSGKEAQTRLGINASNRNNVIQAAESMFWLEADQTLIQGQLTRFRRDLIERNLDNPMVYLEDEHEILAMQDPGELYYFIMMDDYWIRQFTYWLFNQLIEIYYELDGK